MALGNPINLRLSIEKQLLYESEASARNLPLGTYLRQRLEAGDEILQEISALRRTIERGEMANKESHSNQDSGVLLEMLLLLRQLAQPQKMQIAHQELKRIGIAVWAGQKVDKSDE